MREQGNIFIQFTEAQAPLTTLKLHGSLFEEAQGIATQASGWQDMAGRAVTEFRNLIPESAFTEANRVAEAFRLFRARPARLRLDPYHYQTGTRH